jgi:hypothetical protein
VRGNLNEFEFDSHGSKDFKLVQTSTDTKGTSQLKIFEIKYDFEDLKKMNNFRHRNFFRFGRDFE